MKKVPTMPMVYDVWDVLRESGFLYNPDPREPWLLEEITEEFPAAIMNAGKTENDQIIHCLYT
jgi:hypothetical protein